MKQYILFVLLILGLYNANSQQMKLKILNSTNTPVFTSNNFKSVAIDKDSAIWAGTQYGGLYVLNPKTKTWSKSSYLTNVFINDIKAHPNGGVYIAQSGTTGQGSGEGNRQGGVVKFTDLNFNGYVYWATNNTGSQSNGGLNSRMARSIWIDTNEINQPDDNRHRLWVTQNSFLTNNATAAGGIGIGANTPDLWFFAKRTDGLQIFPNTNLASSRTPSVDAICGNKDEVWVSVRQNYGGSEILKYSAKGRTFLGGFSSDGEFDNRQRVYAFDTQTIVNKLTVGVLQAGFRVNAMYNDTENRKWIGMANGSGGLILVDRGIWTKVNLSSILPTDFGVNINAIYEDENGRIYFGTDKGLLVFEGLDPQIVDNYKLYTTSNGLPTNNINGISFNKSNNEIILATDAGVVIWDINKPVDISLDWDYSFPKPKTKPKGVAADGVSRLYIKIKKNSDTIPEIQKIVVKIKDVEAGLESERGRLKEAIVENSYSDEANNRAQFEAEDFTENEKNEFVFWYKSPEDFCLNNLSVNSKASTRKEKIDIFVYFENSRIDTINYDLTIVRPPVVFVHGLASNPECWNNLREEDGEPSLVNSNYFKYTKALTLDGAGKFQDNGLTLVSESSPDYKIKSNSLGFNIDQLRQMGYASNQVDYISHSMGGLVIRMTISEYSNLFYRNNASLSYNNYGYGYLHKYITLNSPHNSSPLADLVFDIAPYLGLKTKLTLKALYWKNKTLQQPFDFIRPTGNDGNFEATWAIKNLQIRDNLGGINLKNTVVKNHMIIGEMEDSYKLFFKGVIETGEYFYEMGKEKVNSKLGENASESYLANILKNYFIEETIEQFRDFSKLYANDPSYNGTIDFDRYIKIGRENGLYEFLEWYSNRFKVYNYLSEGDVIVPLKSQLADQDITSSHITHYKSRPGTNDALHMLITQRTDVAKKVMELLNNKVNNNPLFANGIPGNTNPDYPSTYLPTNRSQNNLVQNNVPSIYNHVNKSKIHITNPQDLKSLVVDSSYNLKINLLDTIDLAYFKISTLDTPIYIGRGNFSRKEFSFKPKLLPPSEQLLVVNAVYDKADGIHYYYDTLHVNVENNGILINFRVVENEAIVEDQFAPIIQVNIDSIWHNLNLNSRYLTVSIDSTSIIGLSDSVGFYAKKNGIAVATISYKGFSDKITLIAAIAPEPECFNKTIKAGNMSDASVWSKNRIPIECDSLLILHNLLIDTAVKVKAMQVSPGVEVRIKANLKGFKIGYNYKMNEKQMMLKEMILPQDFRKGYYYKSKSNIA